MNLCTLGLTIAIIAAPAPKLTEEMTRDKLIGGWHYQYGAAECEVNGYIYFYKNGKYEVMLYTKAGGHEYFRGDWKWGEGFNWIDCTEERVRYERQDDGSIKTCFYDGDDFEFIFDPIHKKTGVMNVRMVRKVKSNPDDYTPVVLKRWKK